MKIASSIAGIFLCAVLFFSWGYSSASLRVFPYHPINDTVKDIQAFIKGSEYKQHTFKEKLLNDTNIAPARFTYSYEAENGIAYKQLELPGKRGRRDNPRIYSSGVQSNLRVLIGAFDFEESFWGAILLNEKNEIIHIWHLLGEIEGLNNKRDISKNLYGAAVLSDGSIVFNMQMSNKGIVKRDYCSQVEWILRGSYHHAIAPDAKEKYFWTFKGSGADIYPNLVKVLIENGEITKSINGLDLYRKNPDLFIFDPRRHQKDDNSTHPNDIEVLDADITPAFPMFSAGDLAINYYNINLVYIFDPNTLKVKYWYYGAGDGAHDVDFQPDGRITLFNNRKRAHWDKDLISQASAIVAINPENNTHTVLYDGIKHGIYSDFNGNHQMILPDRVMLDSSVQGRFTEIDLNTNKITFDFINDYNRSNKSVLHISESFTIPRSFFNFDVDERKCL